MKETEGAGKEKHVTFEKNFVVAVITEKVVVDNGDQAVFKGGGAMVHQKPPSTAFAVKIDNAC